MVTSDNAGSINSPCTYYITVNKCILITANKRIHIISAYFLAVASDRHMCLLTSLYGTTQAWYSIQWHVHQLPKHSQQQQQQLCHICCEHTVTSTYSQDVPVLRHLKWRKSQSGVGFQSHPATSAGLQASSAVQGHPYRRAHGRLTI